MNNKIDWFEFLLRSVQFGILGILIALVIPFGIGTLYFKLSGNLLMQYTWWSNMEQWLSVICFFFFWNIPLIKIYLTRCRMKKISELKKR